MRIGITINTSWNIYNFRKGLVLSLLEKGHQVIAIAPEDEYSKRIIEWGCDYVPIRIDATGANPLHEAEIIRKYRQIIKEQRIDIILSYTIKPNLYATLACRLCSIPIICNVSGLGTAFLATGFKSTVAQLLYQLIFRFSSFIFFQNEEDRKDFLSVINLQMSKTHVLPGSGINLTDFSVHEYHTSENPVFLMVSRLIIDKGIREFAEAAIALKFAYPKTRFVIAGQLDEKHHRSIKKAELDSWQKKGVEYVGYTDNVTKLYKTADVVVLPSYREGTPKTLLEAAAIGLPLIATDVPGCRELVVDNENGFLCKPASAIDLKTKMELFIHLDDKEKINMSEKSRSLVEKKYDENIVINAYLRQIKTLTNP